MCRCSQHPLFRGHLIYNLWRDWYFLCVCTAGNVSLCIQVLMCFWVRLREDRGVKMTINRKCHLHKHLSSILDQWKKNHIFSKNNCSVCRTCIFSINKTEKGRLACESPLNATRIQGIDVRSCFLLERKIISPPLTDFLLFCVSTVSPKNFNDVWVMTPAY